MAQPADPATAVAGAAAAAGAAAVGAAAVGAAASGPAAGRAAAGGAAGAAPGNGAAAPRARHAAAAQVRWQQEQLQLRAEPGGRHDESRQSRRRRRSHERLWQLPGPVSQALPDQHIQHRLLSDQR